MEKVSKVGSLLKKIYRLYSNQIIQSLEDQGFLDLRISFLEILLFISQNPNSSIKVIGQACGLKKQTMTSHLNELEKRGYVQRSPGLKDKREFQVNLTEYGVKFKLALFSVVTQVEQQYEEKLGEVELERVCFSLENFHNKIS